MEPYRNRIKKISTGDTYDDLEDTEVKQGFMRQLDLITCENVNHAYTELRIGVRRAGADEWLEGEKSPSAATLYWMDDPVILAEGEQLVVRMTGCADGDELNVTIRGVTQAIARPAPAPAPEVRRPVVRPRPRLAWGALG